jgi:hypothetical protein
VEAAFQREADQIFLELKLTNHTTQELRDFMLKLNSNYYGICLEEMIPGTFSL